MIAIFPEICAETDPCKVAQLARQYFILRPHTVTPDLEAMVLRCGLKLSYQHLDTQNTKAILAVKDDKGRFEGAILIQETVSLEERPFLLTHCLGLYFLKTLPSIARGDFKTCGYKIIHSPLEHYIQQGFSDIDEQQASRFSSEILLPEDKVQRAFKKINNIESLASFFRVSPLCMERRVVELGLTSASKHLSLKSTSSPAPRQLKMTVQRPAKQQQPSKQQQSAASLQRIRALAQKIDQSVKT
ncbi:MAG: ImmA/IrrE family metallo-endopeptidase [Oligoflexales bacterium]